MPGPAEGEAAGS